MLFRYHSIVEGKIKSGNSFFFRPYFSFIYELLILIFTTTKNGEGKIIMKSTENLTFHLVFRFRFRILSNNVSYKTDKLFYTKNKNNSEIVSLKFKKENNILIISFLFCRTNFQNRCFFFSNSLLLFLYHLIIDLFL